MTNERAVQKGTIWGNLGKRHKGPTQASIERVNKGSRATREK